ncbi:MAG TPA: endonuclease/exonuclease/phosphatase family protein [Candidatus Saccharimonadales bacterium]|nr:endonuclease/exonuclease/phosphatase family protein [Candidatus Saccharimonadales bacterium]
MGKPDPFTALFWNVWVESQQTAKRLQQLKTRFDTIITTYQPHTFGLNEVLADNKGKSSLLQHLESQGYHTFFAPFSPERNGVYSGSALATRTAPLLVQFHELGPDKYGAVRGFPGHTIKLIQAQVQHGGKQVNIVVNYLAHLVPWNWKTHIGHHKAFRNVVNLPDLQTTTIIGGDFNQFKFMPHMWGAKSMYHRATGTVLHPTWRLIGKFPIIQANYDNIFWTKCGTLTLDEFKVLGRHPSDHTPLVARFRLSSGE